MPNLSRPLFTVMMLSSFASLTLVFAGPKNNNADAFVDVERSLTKQEAAAKVAKDVVNAGPAKLNEIMILLQDKAVPVRDTVVLTLAKSWSVPDLEKLAAGLKSKNPLIVEGIAEIFEERKVKAGLKAILPCLGLKRAEDAVVACLRAISVIGDESAFKDVEKLFKRERKSFRVRGEALRTMVLLSRSKSEKALSKAMTDKMIPVRIMALVTLGELDEGAGISAVATNLKTLKKVRDELWRSRLLFTCLDTLRLVRARSKYKKEFSEAMPLVIAELKDSKGREEWELGQTLADLTGDKNRAPDYESWKYWWEANKEKWEPKDLVVKTPAKKKKKGKGKDKAEEADAPERASGSTVSFHGVPIHSKRLIFAQDISGGMKNPVGGRGSDTPAKLTISKEELNKVLGQLSDDTYVNLSFFASYFYSCAPGPLPVKKFRQKLQQFTREQKAPTKRGHGRSNLYDTIAHGIKQDNIDTVFVLTEGGPSEGKYLDTSRFVKHLNRLNVFYRCRVHTMLMTASKAPKAKSFLQTVAESTGGSFYDLKELRDFTKKK